MSTSVHSNHTAELVERAKTHTVPVAGKVEDERRVAYLHHQTEPDYQRATTTARKNVIMTAWLLGRIARTAQAVQPTARVAWSVCLCVRRWRSWALQKRMNRSRCHLGVGPRNRVLDGGPGPSPRALMNGTYGTCPVVDLLRVSRKVAARGDAACSPPLSWQLVSNTTVWSKHAICTRFNSTSERIRRTNDLHHGQYSDEK